MRISDWSSDVCSSDLLWQFNAGLGILGGPMSFSSGGKQYVSVLVGYGGSAAVTRDRKSVVEGKSVSVRVDLGGSRIIKKKKHKTLEHIPIKYQIFTVLYIDIITIHYVRITHIK